MISYNAFVIVLASVKGGVGKTTTAITLASEYAEQGYRVHIIDADELKADSFIWFGGDADSIQARKEAEASGETLARLIPENITVSRSTMSGLDAEIRLWRHQAEVLIIDLQGSHNEAFIPAIEQANFVIIPTSKNVPDARAAIRTAFFVADVGRSTQRHIPHAVLFTLVQSAIRSRVMKDVEEQVAASGVPLLGELPFRSAFAALHSFSATLDTLPASEVSGIDKAKGDAIRLTDAIALLVGASPNVSETPTKEDLA